MVERIPYEYSIISYLPDRIREEKINIGLLFKNSLDKKMTHFILKSNTPKARGLITTESGRKLFGSTIKYLNFIFEKEEKKQQTELFSNLLSDTLLDGIIISKPKNALTSNPSALFSTLLKTYIGDQYLETNEELNIITPKQFSENLFKEQKSLGSVIRQNVRLRPAKSVPMRLQVDFAYEKSGNLGLINTVPSLSSADEWYAKMVVLSSRFQSAGQIVFLNDSRLFDSLDIRQMLYDLTSGDSRAIAYDIGSADEKYGRERYLKFVHDIAKTSDEKKLNVLIAKERIPA